MIEPELSKTAQLVEEWVSDNLVSVQLRCCKRFKELIYVEDILDEKRGILAYLRANKRPGGLEDDL